MGWREKARCPVHHGTLHPLYYRDYRGVFVRWFAKYLCLADGDSPHVVDDSELPVSHLTYPDRLKLRRLSGQY